MCSYFKILLLLFLLLLVILKLFYFSGVLNLCADWIVSHIETARIKEFVAFILTIASLNFFTLEAQRTLQAILPLTTFEKVKSADVWLDIVWSLAILNITDRDMLLKVLSPTFYEPLISE